MQHDTEFCTACMEFCTITQATPPADDWSAGFAFAACPGRELQDAHRDEMLAQAPPHALLTRLDEPAQHLSDWPMTVIALVFACICAALLGEKS